MPSGFPERGERDREAPVLRTVVEADVGNDGAPPGRPLRREQATAERDAAVERERGEGRVCGQFVEGRKGMVEADNHDVG